MENIEAKVADYDEFNYDYKTYWKSRNYEDQAEKLALIKLFKGHKGMRLLDIGGSYGRLLPIYNDKYKECVILDYSLETLLKYENEILDQLPNTKLIAANVYHMPFRENSFDSALMIRVLHHIEDIDNFLKELSTILAPGAFYIQEFANKIHLKARIKWIVTGKFKMLGQTPYQQPNQNNYEGTKDKTAIFLNYHPDFVVNILKQHHFEVTKNLNSSFFRIAVLKKIFSSMILAKLDSVFQDLFSWLNFAPSILLATKLSKKSSIDNISMPFRDILICPNCKSELEFGNESAHCPNCGRTYTKHSTVWDFRIS